MALEQDLRAELGVVELPWMQGGNGGLRTSTAQLRADGGLRPLPGPGTPGLTGRFALRGGLRSAA
jgi:hypothetical protein